MGDSIVLKLDSRQSTRLIKSGGGIKYHLMASSKVANLLNASHSSKVRDSRGRWSMIDGFWIQGVSFKGDIYFLNKILRLQNGIKLKLEIIITY